MLRIDFKIISALLYEGTRTEIIGLSLYSIVFVAKSTPIVAYLKINII